MGLYKELLVGILQREAICVTFPNLALTAKELLELESYQALQKIQTIIGHRNAHPLNFRGWALKPFTVKSR